MFAAIVDMGTTKLFDRVPHNHLVLKIPSFRIIGALHRLRSSYRKGSSQIVKIREHLSLLEPITAVFSTEASLASSSFLHI